MPEIFKMLEENRECICINGCISNQGGKAKFLQMKGGGHQMLSGLVDKYDKRHLSRIENEIQIFGGTKEEIEVDCYVLNELLEQHNMLYIDYCSIDVEGAELDILQSIDFDKVLIDVFTVENNYHDKRIKDFLVNKGYELIEVLDCDEVYKKKL
jgi:FkbM family methyltransferase